MCYGNIAAAAREIKRCQENPMTQPPILFHSEGAVAHITLNRPDRRNAIGGGMGEALDAALAALRDDKVVRVVVLRGAGGSGVRRLAVE